MAKRADGGVRGRRRRYGRRAQRAQQVEIVFPLSHGGRRKNAGRKPKNGASGVRHRRREKLAGKHHPVHVTMRVVKGLKTLRGFDTYPVIRRAIARARDRLGSRIIEYSVQGNHLHFIIESKDEHALGRAMKGLCVRIARGLNTRLRRHGQVFADRYHARPLRTPTEVRRALICVLQNGAKHAAANGSPAADLDWSDPFSSAPFFRGWDRAWRRAIPKRDAPTHPLHRDPTQPPIPTAPPHTWLLTDGWIKVGGLLKGSERPAH